MGRKRGACADEQESDTPRRAGKKPQSSCGQGEAVYIRRLCGEGVCSYPGRSRLMPERAKCRTRRSVKRLVDEHCNASDARDRNRRAQGDTCLSRRSHERICSGHGSAEGQQGLGRCGCAGHCSERRASAMDLANLRQQLLEGRSTNWRNSTSQIVGRKGEYFS